MAICQNCGDMINKGTANQRKVHGVTVHKECPNKRSNRIIQIKESRKEKRN